MAGDWIKFEAGTPDKPEVWQIAESLSIDPDAVVGKLLRVWAWFDQQTEDGNAPIVSRLLLDRLVGVNGFCNSVMDAGWMTIDGDYIVLTNFDRHNGKTAKNRALTAKRVANHKAKSNDDGNDELTPTALPREEKRREEVKPKQSRDQQADNAPPVPYEKIFEAYAEKLSALPQLKLKDDARKQAIKSLWRRSEKFQTVEFWEKYFTYVGESAFLTTQCKAIGFDWIMKPANFKKILEGNYHGE